MDALALLTKAQRAAAVVILRDFDRHAHRIERGPRPGAVIERCPGFYTPSRTISPDLSDRVFAEVIALLGARKIDGSGAAKLGYPVRPLAAGKRFGKFLFLPDPTRPAKLLAELARRGLAPVAPVSKVFADEAIEIRVRWRGLRRLILCPGHDERVPSAEVNDSGLVWCYAGCGEVGRAEESGPDAVRFWRLLRAPPPAPGVPRLPGPVTREGPTVGIHYSGGTGSASNLRYSTRIIERTGSPGEAPERAVHVLGRLYHMGCGQSASAVPDLIRLLRVADERCAREGTWERAWEADARHAVSGVLDHRDYLPDLTASLGLYVPRRSPDSPRPSYDLLATRYLGVDLDGFTRWPTGNRELAAAGERIREAVASAHPVLSGRIAVVRTSAYGVQVVFELAQTRWDPRAFHVHPDVQRMSRALDRLCLVEVRAAGFEGGHADESIHAPGRYVRRPGPRRCKLGTIYLSRLVFSSE